MRIHSGYTPEAREQPLPIDAYPSDVVYWVTVAIQGSTAYLTGRDADGKRSLARARPEDYECTVLWLRRVLAEV